MDQKRSKIELESIQILLINALMQVHDFTLRLHPLGCDILYSGQPFVADEDTGKFIARDDITPERKDMSERMALGLCKYGTAYLQPIQKNFHVIRQYEDLIPIIKDPDQNLSRFTYLVFGKANAITSVKFDPTLKYKSSLARNAKNFLWNVRLVEPRGDFSQKIEYPDMGLIILVDGIGEKDAEKPVTTCMKPRIACCLY